jgi:parallel beta-helix repeat protein
VQCPATVQQNTLTENLDGIELLGQGCTVRNNSVTP